MNYSIKNAVIVLDTGEEICGEFGKVNIFVGEKSSEVIQTLAEWSCTCPLVKKERTNRISLTYVNGEKTYEVCGVSTACGAGAFVKYESDTDDFNKEAFFEHQRLLEKFTLLGDTNIFDNSKKTAMDESLNGEERTRLNLREFYDLVMNPIFKSDPRPLFLRNLDAAPSDLIREILAKASATDRQVFIAVKEELAEHDSRCRIFLTE